MWLLIALMAGPAWTDAGVGQVIKKAERAGDEPHAVAGGLRLMRPGARWIVGRTAVADAHDVVMTQKTVADVLRLQYAGPPGSRRVDFLETTVELDADPPRVMLTQSRRFSGGRVLTGTLFELARDAKGWGVVTRREWPIEERMGPLPTLYDAAFWLDADTALEQPCSDTLAERFSALLNARRYAQLAREATRLAARGGTDPKIWTFWAQAAYRLGQLSEARRLARIAGDKGGLPQLPSQLMP
jgi:hypothetical protein